MKAFRYTMEIDEEGFPLFDGLRIDDEPFVKSLFENFYRLEPGNVHSSLMTVCEGEKVLVAAFESPLVAQSVSDFSLESSRWHFPGNIMYRVDHSQVRVDAWNRVRTQVGELKVNATLSRKAQVQFGQKWAELKIPMSFKNWYQVDPQKSLNNQYWDSAYQSKKDGWEMHEPTPVLVNEFSKVQANFPFQGESCVVLGAGRGHEAQFVAQHSQMNVIALDFAETAEKEFHKIYPDSRAQFIREDAFQFLAKSPSAHSMIVEHTFFCAIDPELRTKYFELVSSALKAGGLIMGIFWMRPSPEGPPFGLSQWELRETIKNFPFDILEWKLSENSWPSRMGQEYFILLKKR